MSDPLDSTEGNNFIEYILESNLLHSNHYSSSTLLPPNPSASPPPIENYSSSSTTLYPNHYSLSTPLPPNPSASPPPIENYSSSSTTLYPNHYSLSTPLHSNYDNSSTLLNLNYNNPSTSLYPNSSSPSTSLYPNSSSPSTSPPLKFIDGIRKPKVTEEHKKLINVDYKDDPDEFLRQISFIRYKLDKGETVDKTTDLSRKYETRSDVKIDYSDNPKKYKSEIKRSNTIKVNEILKNNHVYKQEWNEIKYTLKKDSSIHGKEKKKKRDREHEKFNQDLLKAHKLGLSVKEYRKTKNTPQQTSSTTSIQSSSSLSTDTIQSSSTTTTSTSLPILTQQTSDIVNETIMMAAKNDREIINLDIKLKKLKIRGFITKDDQKCLLNNALSKKMVEIEEQRRKENNSDKSKTKLVSKIPELNPVAVNENDTFNERMDKLIALEKIKTIKKKLADLKNK
jgi:hypothetical protein